ncbi:MAG: YceI family protein [Deltaproteobacteria bacterium]|nr:YceI family protein [Deltaproteobacteria bacterium]
MKTAVMRVGAILVVGVAVVACKDPSAGKPRATVGAAVPDRREATAARGAAGATYAISADTSKIGFVGSKVTGSHVGGFAKFTGTVDTDAQKPGSITVEIDATSLFSDTEKLTAHLKSADFFDVAKFPKATFASTDIRAGGTDKATHTITGNLELHGVKKSVAFPATVAFVDNSAAVTATSEFSINRKDFGIVYPGMKDDLIRDNVLIKLSINAKRVAR